MVTANIGAVRAELPELVNRVAYGNERVVVMRRNKPIAAIVPIRSLAVMQRLEELLDFELVQERLATAGEKVMTIQEFADRIGVEAPK